REPQHGVVRVANQERAAFQPPLHFAFEPHVQDLVQVDVREQWRDNATLWRPHFWVPQVVSLEHAGMKPLADVTQHKSIAYPLLDDLPKPAGIKSVEETLDIQ